MKKVLALVLALAMIFCFVACGEDYTKKSKGVLTYAEFVAAKLDTEVTVECFVQAFQGWWDNKITVYAADPDGGYFLYNMACTKEDSAKLKAGTKIKVTGTKSEWKGEVEIMNATFEFVGKGDGYIATAVDATAFTADKLKEHINQLVTLKGMTFLGYSLKQSDDDPDIYVSLSLNGDKYEFCVENYLTGPDTEVYKTIKSLVYGDVVDITGFNYYYTNPNMHITACNIVKRSGYADKSEGVLTYEQFALAPLDKEVTVEAFVQGYQGWWGNKITVYAADLDGGYFFYNLACTEADAAKLIPGAKIKVTGTKAEWKGEVEIVNGTFTFCDSGDGYIRPAVDATNFSDDELYAHINELVTIKGMVFESLSYKASDDDPDIYVKLSFNGKTYEFCVENYLTGPKSDVYKTVANLNKGDIVNITGYNYYYSTPNMHMTACEIIGNDSYNK